MQDQVKRVYPFIKGQSDGRTTMKALLGGKGANLCEMARLGLNVPPGTQAAVTYLINFAYLHHAVPCGSHR